MDFLEYEASQYKDIIVAVSSDNLDIAKKEYSGHSYSDRLLRPYEQNMLIHSTTWDCWQSIKKDGCLKSWNVLKSENPDYSKNRIFFEPIIDIKRSKKHNDHKLTLSYLFQTLHLKQKNDKIMTI